MTTPAVHEVIGAVGRADSNVGHILADFHLTLQLVTLDVFLQ